jgi:hypothetical protein
MEGGFATRLGRVQPGKNRSTGYSTSIYAGPLFNTQMGRPGIPGAEAANAADAADQEK